MTKTEKAAPRAASSVDRQIGARVRARRLQLRMSQELLARTIGVTFQQIQKYEKGVNRIAASTLIDIAAALTIQPSALLPRVEGAASSSLDDPEFSAVLGRLNGEGRRVLANIGRTFAEDDQFRASKKKTG